MLVYSVMIIFILSTGACPGIRKGGGGPKSESFFFFAFQYFRGGGPQLRK